MPDIPDAFLIHKISGRARLKIPSKRGDLYYFNSLKEQLSGFSGIETIDLNPMLGSIIIRHTSEIEKIANYARERNIFDLKNNKINSKGLHLTISRVYQDINGKIKGITGGDIDIPGIAFLTLLGLGIYQISRGNFAAPAWYTAFWYALNIFLKSGHKGVE